MGLFARKQPIVLDLFTDRRDAYEYARPQLAHRYFPQWWKDLPNDYWAELRKASTMRRCEGFVQHYQRGFVIPLWSDLNVQVQSRPGAVRWQYADGESRAVIHPVVQRGSYLPEERYQHLKLDTPWKVRCEEEVQFLFSGAFWNNPQPEKLLIAPGIVDFKYQHQVALNLFLLREAKDVIYELKLDTPMAHVIPLSERKLELRHHLIAPSELDELREPGLKLSFTNRYKTAKRLRSLMRR